MSFEGDKSELLLLLDKCKPGMALDEHLNACRELLCLVKSQRVRDAECLPPKTYSLPIDAICLGWERGHAELLSVSQDAFLGLVRIPEFEASEAERFLNDGFLLELCARFHVGFADERDFLRDILHWLYESFPQKRITMRQQIGSMLEQFARSPNTRFHVSQLLQVLRGIIQGFPSRLSQVHLSLFTDTLLPLHQPNQMAEWSTQQSLLETYHEDLVGCLVPFVEAHSDLVQVALEAIVAAWPAGFDGNTPKEVLLLHELDTFMKYVRTAHERSALDIVMPKVVGCLRLEHIRIIERALFMFKNRHFLDMVARHSGTFYKSLLSALLRGGEPFWNPTVTKMTAHVLDALESSDAEAFAAGSEALWGHGGPAAPQTEDHEAATYTPPEEMEAEVPLAEPHRSHDIAIANTTLRGAMGSWRPSSGPQGASLPPTNPPAIVTGVAPWALKQPSHPSRLRTGVPASNVPLHSIKRVRRREAGDSRAGAGSSSSDRDAAATVAADSAANRDSPGDDDGEASPGLTRVRAFLAKIRPKEAKGTNEVSWQQLQLEPTPTLLPELRFHHLVFGQELGQGSFSVVKYARHITKGKSRSEWPEFAVKIVSTAKIQELNYEKSVTNEIACLRILSHPGIARLVSAFRWRDGAYLVLEYASRGDLHSHIKQHGSLSEDSTRFVMGEVVAALCSVHESGFIFGDLKPENILITESGHIKITDFGACRPATEAARDVLKRSRHALDTLRDGDWRTAAGLPPNPSYTPRFDRRSQRDDDSSSDESNETAEKSPVDEVDVSDEARAEGTAAYMAPEVARDGTPGFGTDAWALGCVTFLCLAGRPPIFDESDEAIMARVVRFASDRDLPSLPAAVSEACRNLIGALMESDPQTRLSVEQAAKHEFFVREGKDVFVLHRKTPVQLAQGSVAPAPSAAWSRRQNSMIWAPMPHEYRFDAPSRELGAIEESAVERGAPFRRVLGALREGLTLPAGNGKSSVRKSP